MPSALDRPVSAVRRKNHYTGCAIENSRAGSNVRRGWNCAFTVALMSMDLNLRKQVSAWNGGDL